MPYEHTSVEHQIQAVVREQFEEPLRQMLGEYLQVLLQQEVAEYLQAANQVLGKGEHQKAVRNGCSRQRSVATALGVVSVRQPRVHDRREEVHLHRIFDAPDKHEAERELQNFGTAYADAYPKAWECLRKDQQELLRFYDYPPLHWKSIRSTNVIESAFSTLRHRTRQTKGAATAERAVAMLVALGRRAEQSWRKLRGAEKLPFVANGSYKHPQVQLPTS